MSSSQNKQGQKNQEQDLIHRLKGIHVCRNTKLSGALSTCICSPNNSNNFSVKASKSKLPVCLRYIKLFSSTGKNPMVAPYSGHMLAMVALSAMDRWLTPGPKNSTNLPTTPIWRRCCKRKSDQYQQSEGCRSKRYKQTLFSIPIGMGTGLPKNKIPTMVGLWSMPLLWLKVHVFLV